MTDAKNVLTIEAEKRSQTGKGYARKLRAAGKIPAVLLHKGASTPIELDPKLLSKVWQGGKVLNLKIEGTVHEATIHELQLDAVKRFPLHVDFKLLSKA